MKNINLEILEKIAIRFDGSIKVTDDAYYLETGNPFIWFTIREYQDKNFKEVIFNGRGGSTWTSWHDDVFKDHDILKSNFDDFFISNMSKKPYKS